VTIEPFSMAEIPVAVVEAGLHQVNLSSRVAKGFNGTVKAILKNKAKIVFLADDCASREYKKLITGLCRKHHVRIHSIPTTAVLGGALGLTALMSDGSSRPAKRQRACAACALVKYGNVQNQSVEALRQALDPEGSEAAV
jgi:ribosomal protein L7Ae-like RNA K-turn-binding protein